MKLNFTLKNCVLLLSVWASINTAAQTRFAEIPTDYRSHPELGKTTHTALGHEPDYELIHERTRYSRTFLNKNTTKTSVQSSIPLHYQTGDGSWHTIDYSLTKTKDKITYPAQNPYFEIDGNRATIVLSGKKILLPSNSAFVFSGDKISRTKTNSSKAVIENSNRIAFKSIAPNIDKTVDLYPQAFKYTYSVNNASALPGSFSSLQVEDEIELPRGFSIVLDKTSNQIRILGAANEELLVFRQPVVSDSKVLARNQRPAPIEGIYELTKITDTKYKIAIRIDGSWLQSPDRVFPIAIDPVVTVSNLDAVNSCFSPNYQQAALQVAVPAGESVLSSNISYDFVAVAGSGAWMEDQRSFVSGPNGQTPVMQGVGNITGLYTYTIPNSPIGNGVSTGQVNFVFNVSRVWGGNGCNATFNFVSRREVAVTYGTIEFGDGPLVINEYSASNRNFNDGFDRNEDWIELYNSSPDTYFNLAGYHLSNNVNNPTKWQIQSGVIPPNSKVLVFCSNRDISTGTVLHASFDLTQTDADEIVIADPSGNIVESHEMFVTQTNHSYGRTTDGASTWSVFATPTPGAANSNAFSNYSTKPTFATAPGMYPGAITVAISSTGANEQIRYTTDGSTPTITSTLYTGPIPVGISTVIRARTFSATPGILPGFIETNSYFINETTTLPVVSLAGDQDLMQLLNGSTLEPTGYFEYFENGVFIDETMGDFDRHGNDSWAYDQRGIDFIARDDHGYKRRLQHQFFNTTDRTNFRRLILKAAGSDNYPHQDGGAHMRDMFAQKLSEVSGLDLDERRSTSVSLFVNGQYWGVYDLREKVDDNQYTDYYYGQDYTYRDSDIYLQYIKTWGATNPEFGNQPAIDAWDDLMDYVQNNDMSVEANYNYVESQLNIDSLVDYFVLNSYLVNKDWLNWNTSWWRGTDPSGGAQKWRYALWDVDGILGHYINFTGIPDISADAAPCNAENLDVGVGHAQTIEKLVDESPIVRQKYVARYADLLNTHFSCDQVTQLFDSIVAVIAPEMPRQIQRWGGNLAIWQANVQEARDFLLTRCSQTISSGLTECYEVTGPFETIFNVEPANTGQIKMNSEWIANYPFTAQVFGNLETLLKADPTTGYEFSHWVVDGAVITPDAQNPDIVLQISQATSVTAHFTELITGGEQAIHYWHFNTLETPSDVTSIAADNTLIAGSSPLMTYTGSGPRDIDANSTGSVINLHFDQSAGKCARVRNPSDGRSLVFDLPTTGYKDIKFAYAVQRTNEGQLANHVSYSTDGINYTQAGLVQTTFNVSTDFSLIEIDLSAMTAANNNPDFKVKIVFEGNTSADNGNNRFDNITLKGTVNTLAAPSHELTPYQVYPNPFTNDVHVISAREMTEIAVFDLVGKKIWNMKVDATTAESLDLSGLNTGVYLLKIKTRDGTITHKLIRQ